LTLLARHLTEPEGEEHRGAVSQPFPAALVQISTRRSSVAEMGESESVQRIRDLLESVYQGAPPLRAEEESELARHCRAALQRTHRHGLDFKSPAVIHGALAGSTAERSPGSSYLSACCCNGEWVWALCS
jgi:hypothetical protein